MLNEYVSNRPAGAERITVLDWVAEPISENLTLHIAHGEDEWAKCKQISKVAVADPDDPKMVYTFDISGTKSLPFSLATCNKMLALCDTKLAP
jgi:hypothetical protein